MTAIIHNALADGILIAAIAMMAGVAVALLIVCGRGKL